VRIDGAPGHLDRRILMAWSSYLRENVPLIEFVRRSPYKQFEPRFYRVVLGRRTGEKSFVPIERKSRLRAHRGVPWHRAGFDEIESISVPLEARQQVYIPGIAQSFNWHLQDGSIDVAFAWSNVSKRFVAVSTKFRSEGSLDITSKLLRLVFGRRDEGSAYELLDSYAAHFHRVKSRDWHEKGFDDLMLQNISIDQKGQFPAPGFIGGTAGIMSKHFKDGSASVFLLWSRNSHQYIPLRAEGADPTGSHKMELLFSLVSIMIGMR